MKRIIAILISALVLTNLTLPAIAKYETLLNLAMTDYSPDDLLLIKGIGMYVKDNSLLIPIDNKSGATILEIKDSGKIDDLIVIEDSFVIKRDSLIMKSFGEGFKAIYELSSKDFSISEGHGNQFFITTNTEKGTAIFKADLNEKRVKPEIIVPYEDVKIIPSSNSFFIAAGDGIFEVQHKEINRILFYNERIEDACITSGGILFCTETAINLLTFKNELEPIWLPPILRIWCDGNTCYALTENFDLIRFDLSGIE